MEFFKKFFTLIWKMLIEIVTNSKYYFWLMLLLDIGLNILVWYLWQTKIVEEMRYVYSPIVLGNVSEVYTQYLIPGLGSFFNLINVLLALFTLRRVRLAAYFLIGGSILIEILILILIRFYLNG